MLRDKIGNLGGGSSALADIVTDSPEAARRRLRYEAEKVARLLEQEIRKPSLPTVSILNTDAEIDPADLKAGEAAARAAGY